MTPLETLERDFRHRVAEREHAILTFDNERAFQLTVAIDELLRLYSELRPDTSGPA